LETVPLPESAYILAITLKNFDSGSIIGLIVVILLLITSALISGSEVAFFSLSPTIKEQLLEDKHGKSVKVLSLLKKPEKLLATILITNNFVNIGIVILIYFFNRGFICLYKYGRLDYFSNKNCPGHFFAFTFGEIIPKVYAARYAHKFSLLMAYPVYILNRFFSPLSSLLIGSTSFVNKRLAKKNRIYPLMTFQTLLKLTENQIKDNKKILEGIVSYGTTDASEIMKPRVDIIAFDIRLSFNEVIEKLKNIITPGFPYTQKLLIK
jgi:putative hemolysin